MYASVYIYLFYSSFVPLDGKASFSRCMYVSLCLCVNCVRILKPLVCLLASAFRISSPFFPKRFQLLWLISRFFPTLVFLALSLLRMCTCACVPRVYIRVLMLFNNFHGSAQLTLSLNNIKIMSNKSDTAKETTNERTNEREKTRKEEWMCIM